VQLCAARVGTDEFVFFAYYNATAPVAAEYTAAQGRDIKKKKYIYFITMQVRIVQSRRLL